MVAFVEHHGMEFVDAQNYRNDSCRESPPAAEPYESQYHRHGNNGRDYTLANGAIPLPAGLFRCIRLYFVFAYGLHEAPYSSLQTTVKQPLLIIYYDAERRPKRRWRWRKLSNAARKSSRPKSGQRVGVA